MTTSTRRHLALAATLGFALVGAAFSPAVFAAEAEYEPAVAFHSTKTRAEVQAELAAAMRDGSFQTGNEGGQALNEQAPSRYPAVAFSTKTRAQVRAETAEAMRTGDIVTCGAAGLTRREADPRRYPQAKKAVVPEITSTIAAVPAKADQH